MSEPVKKRPYHSALRAEQARATRARILASARSLFTARGYAGTTLEDVGRDAGVAADTVLHTFASKRGLLRAVLDVEIGGDDAPVQFLDREEPQAMRHETDQRRQVAMFAAGVTALLERIRPMDDILRSAAAVDPDARSLRDDLQLRQRKPAMREIAGWIAANGPLRDGITVDDAAAMLWTLTSPEVHELLRDRCGWDVERYLAWLTQTLDDGLLGPTKP